MNDEELIGKVYSSMHHQCQKRGYAAPVDVLMDIGILPKQKSAIVLESSNTMPCCSNTLAVS